MNAKPSHTNIQTQNTTDKSKCFTQILKIIQITKRKGRTKNEEKTKNKMEIIIPNVLSALT